MSTGFGPRTTSHKACAENTTRRIKPGSMSCFSSQTHVHVKRDGMSTSSVATETAAAKSVRVTDRALVVELRDGRVVSVPLAWYPRLAEGSPRERRLWEFLGPGLGIHWPDLDEDISV